jgi:checkpoint serine/threonine-protein kinase
VINPKSGRRERILVDLQAVYPSSCDLGTEMSFEELRAEARSWRDLKWEKEIIPSHLRANDMEAYQNREETSYRTAAFGSSDNMKVYKENSPQDDLYVTDQRAQMEVLRGNQNSHVNTIYPSEEANSGTASYDVVLDENGAVKNTAREIKSRRKRTVEVNETQISE